MYNIDVGHISFMGMVDVVDVGHISFMGMVDVVSDVVHAFSQCHQ
jgi:hypothetical protein